jgi:rhamnose transport system ATP-binding protein
VPEDRRQQGLVMDLSIARNATMTRTSSLARFGLVRRAAENELAREWATRLQLKFHRLDDPAGFLSGGNQQKVVLAKWLATEPRVLIVDEPTRGVDIGAKLAIYELIRGLASEGIAILLISSEHEEVLGLAHRVLIMRAGRIVAELGEDEMSEDALLAAALGTDREAA